MEMRHPKEEVVGAIMALYASAPEKNKKYVDIIMDYIKDLTDMLLENKNLDENNKNE